MDLKALSPPARVYLLMTYALGLLAAAWNGNRFVDGPDGWLAFAALAVAAAGAQAFPVVTPKNQAYELTPVFIFAAMLLLPPDAVSLLIVLAFIPQWVRSGKPWYVQLFNIASCLIQVAAARGLYLWIGEGAMGLFGNSALVVGAVLSATLYTVLNHLLLATVLRLARGHSWKDTRLFELEYFLTDSTLACTGAIAGLLWLADPWLASLIAAPLFLIYRALNTPNLQEEARTDPKTGLYNVKHFNKVLQEEFRRAVRFDRPLVVIMADLDYLRDVNNRYGHMAGDAVLLEVARTIRGSLREYDLAARFGGEEFVLMLPETDTAQGLVVAERLRRQVAEARVPVTTSVEPISVTISLGIASFPKDGISPEQVVHQADLAVYFAKLSGRNRSWPCSPESRALGVPGRRPADLDVAAAAPSAHGAHQAPGSTAPSGDIPAALERRLLDPRSGAADGRDGRDSLTRAPGAGAPAADSRSAGGGQRTSQRERASDLSWRMILLIISVSIASLAAWLVVKPWLSVGDWLGLAVLAALTVGAQSMGVEIYGRGRISTSAVVILAGCMILGVPGALLLAPMVPITVRLTHRGGKWHRNAFDLGNITLSSSAAAAIYGMLSAAVPDSEPALLIGPAIAAALLYYVVNVGLVSTAIGLSEGRSTLAVWDEKFRWLPIHYAVFGAMALLMALAYSALGIYGLVSFAVPPLMLRYSMKQFIERTESNVSELKRLNSELVTTLDELRETYDATLHSLSAALDSRDAETEGHCQQVVSYARAVAEQLHLSKESIADLLNGALLHDVGKIGVPDAILRKRGPLTPQEWEIMRTHPEAGYQMLQHIGFLRNAIPIVRHHHERYDGRGYPDGLCGEEIPLGARIFAVADCFHAITSDRPYRKAASVENAREEIARHTGTQFDPRVVEAFLKIDVNDLARLCALGSLAAAALHPQHDPEDRCRRTPECSSRS